MQDVFKPLLGGFTSDQKVIDGLWDEIVSCYGEHGRHYHNMLHLMNLYGELENVRADVKQWDVMMFALLYHDIVYNTLRKDNEERSAELARKRLLSLGVDDKRINQCCTMILATKGHTVSHDNDINLFTDADLSVLGKDASLYLAYAAQVRKEYSVYPSLIYNPGRKKVLKHFLSMERIFKTPHFYSRYEEQARRNLLNELESLL